MKKPDLLRTTLLQFVPALAADPSKLSVFIDKGRVAARPGSLHLEYGYTLNVVVQDFAGDLDQIVVPILAWITRHQPDLLQRQDDQPFRFETELLNADTADVSIWIDLTEAVRVTPQEGGGFTADRIDDAADTDDFGIGCVPLWTLVLGDRTVAESSDPRHTGVV